MQTTKATKKFIEEKITTTTTIQININYIITIVRIYKYKTTTTILKRKFYKNLATTTNRFNQMINKNTILQQKTIVFVLVSCFPFFGCDTDWQMTMMIGTDWGE